MKYLTPFSNRYPYSLKLFFIKHLFILCAVIGYVPNETSAAPAYFQVSTNSDTSYVKQLLTESFREINQGKFSSAYPKIREAKRISDSLNYLDGQALAVVRMADAYLSQQKNDSAITILNQAVIDYPESRRIIDFYNFLATAFHYKSEAAKAVDFYQKALQLVPSVPEGEQARTTAGIRQNLAGALMSQGNHPEAFENYLIAVRFSEMTRDTLFWVTTLNNIGNAYNEIENHEDAVYYLQKAKNIAEVKGFKGELYRINLNLANAKSALEEFEEARKLYNTALKIEAELRPGAPPIVILYNLGRLSGSMGLNDKAEEYFLQSLNHSISNNITPGIYYNNFGLGNLYYEMNRYQDAISKLKRALLTAEQMRSLPFIQETTNLLYKAHREAGQYESALEYFEEYQAVEDSLFDTEKAQALANLQSQMELDRQSEVNRLLQEKQVQQEKKLQSQFILIITSVIIIALISFILIMMKRRGKEREVVNEQLMLQKKKLEEADEAKNKLFSIVAHDLRSPLTALQGILYLIKNKVLSNEEIQELAQELEISVKQNVDTMEDILAWANEQLAGAKIEIEELPLKKIVDDVLAKQSQMFSKKKIGVNNQIENDVIVLGDKNALELVLRNLISNSIKFTHSGGSITTSNVSENGICRLKVADTGIGIPPEDTHKIFSYIPWTRKGTANEKGTGYGLTLCKEFIQKMNGTIKFESQVNKGTTFIIELPKSKRREQVSV